MSSSGRQISTDWATANTFLHSRDAEARNKLKTCSVGLIVWEDNAAERHHRGESGQSTSGVLWSLLSGSLWLFRITMSSLDRKIEQILSSGDGSVDRLSDIVNELVDSEAYVQLQTVLNRIVGDNVPQQVRG
jgi:hypothetical protein